MSDPGDAAAATLALLARRASGATICPSEVARCLAEQAGSGDWRALMPAVHDAAACLAAAGQVRLTWQGVPRHAGPYRIGRAGSGDGADG